MSGRRDRRRPRRRRPPRGRQPLHRYALLTTDPQSPFSWLHSIEDPDLALPVTRPWDFFPDYEVVLADEDAAALGLGGDVAADVWVTVRAAASIEHFTVNLRAPIVVTPSASDGAAAFQVINEAPGLDVRTPLFAASAAAGSGPAAA